MTLLSVGPSATLRAAEFLFPQLEQFRQFTAAFHDHPAKDLVLVTVTFDLIHD
jgi:hypothetical protein